MLFYEVFFCFLLSCDEIIIFVFFFFQAEDGIRDVAVTGAQTCALPISSPAAILLATWSGRTRMRPIEGVRCQVLGNSAWHHEPIVVGFPARPAARPCAAADP